YRNSYLILYYYRHFLLLFSNTFLQLPLCFSFFASSTSTHFYTLSLHDALPILARLRCCATSRRLSVSKKPGATSSPMCRTNCARSEEHTSELQSHLNLVCRLLLEKKKEDKDSSTVVAECRFGT